MTRHLARVVAGVALSLASAGCSLLGGLRVETIEASAQKPGNVALYVEVTDHGEPVTNLEPKNFKIYENEELLSPKQTGRTLLAPDKFTDQRILLLVDVSGNPAPDQRELYAKAAEAFVRKLLADVPVTVKAFDGGPTLMPAGDFARGAPEHAVPALASMKGSDSSRNLNGAIVAGLKELDARSSGKPVKLGTLVVFSRGPDLAGRVSSDVVSNALYETKNDVIGVVIGPDSSQLDFLPGGVVHAEDGDSLPIAFEEAGSRVSAAHRKYYLVAYCSPARAGGRRVRVEVTYTDLEGNDRSGDTTYELDATGFGAGCHPDTPPRFEHPKPKPDARAGGDAAAARDGEAAVVPPPESGDYEQ
jgi:hypothetical protein